MKKVLIFIENEKWNDSIDLLACADQIFAGEEYESYCVAFNLEDTEAISSIKALFDYFVSINERTIEVYDALNMAGILEDLHRKYNFECILIGASPLGRALAPRLSARLTAPLCADITAIEKHSGEILLVRPAFCGKLFAEIISIGRPIMASVRSGVFKFRKDVQKNAYIIDYKVQNIKPCGIKCVGVIKKEETLDIRTSEILVSVGAGVGRSFKKIENLAQALNAIISASRKIVDDGIVPRSIQVGQSGKTVSPKLYIALGIKGAMQHIEGMKNSQYIISVNTDRNAPICSLSDIVVESDAVEFAQKLADIICVRKK